MSERLIGAVAIEDEEITFAKCSFEPSTDRLRDRIEPIGPVPKPKVGYSKAFIGKEIKEFFNNTPGNFTAIGISMFGVVDADSRTLISVPRRDWCKEEFEGDEDSNVNFNFEAIFNDKRWANTHIGYSCSTPRKGKVNLL